MPIFQTIKEWFKEPTEVAKGIGKSILRELFVQPGIEEAPPSIVKERQLKLKEWLKPRTELEERAAKVPRAISEVAQDIGGGILRGVTGRYVEPEETKYETEAGIKVAGAVKTMGEMLGWLVPFGAITKGFGLGIKAATKIPLMAKAAEIIAPKIPSLVKRGIELGVPFGVLSALEKPEGEMTRTEAAGTAAAFGMALPFVALPLRFAKKPAQKALTALFRKVELKMPGKIVSEAGQREAVIKEAESAMVPYENLKGDIAFYSELNKGKAEHTKALIREIADAGYKPQIVGHPTIRATYTVRPYTLGYGCDGSTTGNVLFLAKDLAQKMGKDFDAIYRKSYPKEIQLAWVKNVDKFGKETIAPKTWGRKETNQLVADLNDVNFHSLADEFEKTFVRGVREKVIPEMVPKIIPKGIIPQTTGKPTPELITAISEKVNRTVENLGGKVRRIWLTGSGATGKLTPESDFDIVIEFSKPLKAGESRKVVMPLLNKELNKGIIGKAGRIEVVGTGKPSEIQPVLEIPQAVKGVKEVKPEVKPEVKRIVKYELPPQYEPRLGKPTWKHGQMLWRTMRNMYGETNKFGTDITQNRGAIIWIIDRLEGGTSKLAPLMKRYEGQRMSQKQYKKLYAMFKARDYDVAGYRHVMANLKGIEPTITEIAPAIPKVEPGEPLPKDLRPLIQEAKKEIKNIEYLYHGTSPTVLNDIKKTGLRFDTPTRWEYEGTTRYKAVNLTKYLSDAEFFGDNVALKSGRKEGVILRIKSLALTKPITVKDPYMEGSYLYRGIIPPQDLEIKVGEKWIPLIKRPPIMAEVMKPPIKPPKPPKPRVVSPTPEPPEGLKITERRMREINKAGISPEEFAPALEAQKRGVIPFPEIQKRSIEIVTRIDEIARMKPGTIKTAEQVEAYRQRINGFRAEVNQLKQNYLASPQDPRLKAIYDEAQMKLNRAIVNVEAIRSEMARGLSAARIEDELTRLMDTTQTNLDKVRAALPAEKQLIFDKSLEALDRQDPRAVMRFLMEFQKASFVEKVLEYYKASLLSAPITQIRNFGGNTIFMLFDIPVRALAGGIDAVAATIGRRPRTVYTHEALRMIYSGLKALPEATIEAIKAMRDEFYQYGARRMTIEAGRRIPAIKGLKGKIVRVPYRFLSAMDLFGRTMKMTVEADALAYRMARQEGKKGLELIQRIAEIKIAPPAEMIDLVTRKAERMIFLEEVGGVLKGLEAMKNRYPGLQFIIPFYRTPVNLVREAYRMTPLRLVGVRKDPWLLNQSTRMEEISRMILGSMIGGTIIWKMLDGSIEITGRPPLAKAERELFYRLGKQPYSVKIGDTWYAYREIHPFATIMFGAAQIAESIKLYQSTGELTEKEIEEQANRLITDTATYIQDLTFFQGLGNFVEAISGGAYNQGLGSIGPNYLGQLLGGFIPNLLYSYQRAADPTIYYTRGFEAQFKKRIPGLAEALLPRRDIYGQPLERPGTFWIRFLSPIQVSKERRDLVDEEMEKLEIAVGYPQRIAFGEPLTDYEYDAYLQDSGARLYEQLWILMSGADYKARPVYEKEKAISKVVTESREQSRYALFTEKKQIADYKKSLIAQNYTEAQAEDMAEARFGKPIEGIRSMGEMFRIYQPMITPSPVREAFPIMGEIFGIK